MDTIPQDTPLKQCVKCNHSFDATPDFFSRDKTRKDGLFPYCHECRLGPAAYARFVERHNILAKEGYKRCATCKRWKLSTLAFFYSNKSMKDGLSHQCKQCAQSSSKVSKEKHREEIKAQWNVYYRNNKTELSRKKKIYWQTHTVRLRERSRRYQRAHREYYLEYQRQYAQSVRGRVIKNAHESKRRAQKQAIGAALTAQQIEQKLKAQKYACYYCFTRFEKQDEKYLYHLEHTIPLSRIEHSPRHDVNYVVLACPTCNLRKHNKLPHEWPEGGRLF